MKIGKYADTDFILALIKEEDWLKENAEDILAEEDRIETSYLSILESIMVLKRSGIEDTVEIVKDILDIAELIHVDEETVLKAAIFMEEKDANPFDAFHAALAQERTIISSDSIYDEIGKEKSDLRE
ncbi:MAG: type II toxin-antitoxin system VapC family toxin [Candidatus Nanohalobium sp.]